MEKAKQHNENLMPFSVILGSTRLAQSTHTYTRKTMNGNKLIETYSCPIRSLDKIVFAFYYDLVLIFIVAFFWQQ